jgi:hypothetical protein
MERLLTERRGQVSRCHVNRVDDTALDSHELGLGSPVGPILREICMSPIHDRAILPDVFQKVAQEYLFFGFVTLFL